jgi:hypothetical protein
MGLAGVHQVHSVRGCNPESSELLPLHDGLPHHFIRRCTVCPNSSTQGKGKHTVLTIHSHTTISGGIAIQAGFLVSFKQLVPEHTVAIAKGLIRMRVKHFPAIFLLANTLSGIIIGTETAMFLAYFGFMTAWIYLRFFRISPSLSSAATGDGSVIRGDASDTFAFAHFFPEPIYTPLAALTDGLYNTCIALGVCTPFSTQDIDAGNEQASARAEGGLPSIMNPSSRGGRGGATRAEAERRRALALKALDQRLHAAAGRGPTTAAPAATSASGPSMLGETSYEPERPDALGDST